MPPPLRVLATIPPQAAQDHNLRRMTVILHQLYGNSITPSTTRYSPLGGLRWSWRWGGFQRGGVFALPRGGPLGSSLGVVGTTNVHLLDRNPITHFHHTPRSPRGLSVVGDILRGLGYLYSLGGSRWSGGLLRPLPERRGASGPAGQVHTAAAGQSPHGSPPHAAGGAHSLSSSEPVLPHGARTVADSSLIKFWFETVTGIFLRV